jgi:GTP-binding protein
MKIVSAEFLKSALQPRDFPKDNRPEIAFAGRSNVGKSSLLNKLLNRKGIAKTSKTPGKTRTINFFTVNEKFYLVDLPGYGFAKVSKRIQEEWGQMITSYLTDREPLRVVAHLIDSRHAPTRNDHELLDLLHDAKVPTLLVATKFDKLRQSERATSIKRIRESFELDDEALVIPCSSVTGEGIKPLWDVIGDCM